jgi:predicted TIM-barrel fold metal-dependent hydrolase
VVGAWQSLFKIDNFDFFSNLFIIKIIGGEMDNISRRNFVKTSVMSLALISIKCGRSGKYFSKWQAFDSHVHLPTVSGKTYMWHNVLPQESDCKTFFDYLKQSGVERILGQGTPDVPADSNDAKLVTTANESSLHWRDKYPDFVVPTCNANPNFLDVSIKEMARMKKEGITWLGEFTGYMHNYKYDTPEFYKILEAASDLNYIVSVHTDNDVIVKLLDDFPKVTWNLCHFTNSRQEMTERFEIGAKHKNMFLDTSGSGIERMGMLELAVEKMSADRILFGSDFPINEPGQSLSRINNAFLPEEDKKKIMRDNLADVLTKHGALL